MPATGPSDIPVDGRTGPDGPKRKAVKRDASVHSTVGHSTFGNSTVQACGQAPEAVAADGPDSNRDGKPASAPGRLKRRAEFLRVAGKGRKAPMPGLVLQALPRDDHATVRLGFTVTKKVGNAVIRNRTRRRLKEAARLLLNEEPVTGYDLVLIGRDGTRARPFDALRDDLRRALKKAGVT